MSLLKNRNFSILLSGQLVSTIGNNLFGIALPWYVYVLTNSKTDLALVGLMQTLPAILGLVVGVWVDRWRKLPTMMASDAIRSVLSLILCLDVILHWPFWTVLAMVLALQIAGQFFNPASSALFPELVDEKDIASGSGLLQSSNASAQLIGTISGGALMVWLGAPLLFLLDGLSFLASVISLLFIRVQESIGGKPNVSAKTADGHARPEQAAAKVQTSGRRRFATDWLEGLRLLTRSRFLMLILIAAIVTNFALAPFDVAMTAWVKGPMRGSAFDLGLVNGGFFLGLILGGILLGILSKRISMRAMVIAGLIGIGLAVASFGLFHQVWAETLICACAGFLAGSLNGSINATFITLIPADLRGRVFGMIGALSTFAMPAGMAIFGTLIVTLPLPVVFAAIGAVCAAAGVLVMLPVRNDIHRLRESADGHLGVTVS